jgi:hypothetical protein
MKSYPLDKLTDLERRVFFVRTERFLRRHGFFFAILLLLGFAAYNICLSIYPLDGDNLIALNLGAKNDVLSLFKGSLFEGNYPFYRPIPYITVIMQYELFKLNTPYYFLFNLGIWIACACCVYLFVAAVSKSRTSAIIAATLVLLDGRASVSLQWIGERQSSMSGLFGLGAIILITTSYRGKWRYIAWTGVFLMLLMSSLSKEYGLAFSGTVILYVLLSKDKHWKSIAAIAILSIIVYGSMRIYSGVTSFADYCEDMGLFRETRFVCYSKLDLGDRFLQHGYNIGASFVGTLFPGLFGGYGALKPSLQEILMVNSPIFLLALVGWIKSPRNTLPFLGLIFLGAILSFVLYRERNQLVGMLGVYMTAGIGLAYLLSSDIYRHYLIKWVIMAILFTILILQILSVVNGNINYYEGTKSLDPCVSIGTYHVNPDIVYQLKEKYNMSDPKCENGLTLK